MLRVCFLCHQLQAFLICYQECQQAVLLTNGWAPRKSLPFVSKVGGAYYAYNIHAFTFCIFMQIFCIFWHIYAIKVNS